MAERPIPELSSDARELLGAFRDAESPSARVRRKHWAGLEQRLAPTPGVVPLDRGRYYAKVVAVTMALAAAVLLAVKLVGLGVSTLAQQGRESAVEAPYQGAAESEGGRAVPRPAEAPEARRAKVQTSAAAAEPEPAVVDEPSEVGESPAEPEPVERPSPRSRPRPSPATEPAPESTAASDLMAELALIKEATRAKDAGRTAAGLTALRRHAQRFPSGTLVDERRVLRAELLCAAGRHDEARAEVQTFLRQRVGSALSGRMRRACPED